MPHGQQHRPVAVTLTTSEKVQGIFANLIGTIVACALTLAAWSFYAGQQVQARDSRMAAQDKRMDDLAVSVAENKADIKAEILARLIDHDGLVRIEENTKGLMRAQGLKPAAAP